QPQCQAAETRVITILQGVDVLFWYGLVELGRCKPRIGHFFRKCDLISDFLLEVVKIPRLSRLGIKLRAAGFRGESTSRSQFFIRPLTSNGAVREVPGYSGAHATRRHAPTRPSKPRPLYRKSSDCSCCHSDIPRNRYTC